VVYGSEGQGLQAGRNQLWHQDTPAVKEVADRFDRFGFALVAGDFDADGFDDLAVGAPGEEVREVSEPGDMFGRSLTAGDFDGNGLRTSWSASMVRASVVVSSRLPSRSCGTRTALRSRRSQRTAIASARCSTADPSIAGCARAQAGPGLAAQGNQVLPPFVTDRTFELRR
jgi:hypothetical protein